MPVILDISREDQGVRKRLERIQERFDDLRPGLKIVGEIVQGSILQNFEVGGRPRKWKRLSDITIKERTEQKKWPGQILVRSGRMKSSIDYQVQPDELVVFATDKRTAVHQFGAKKGSFGEVRVWVRPHKRGERSVKGHYRTMRLPWGDIPARPFMMVQAEDWRDISERLGALYSGH